MGTVIILPLKTTRFSIFWDNFLLTAYHENEIVDITKEESKNLK